MPNGIELGNEEATPNEMLSDEQRKKIQEENQNNTTSQNEQVVNVEQAEVPTSAPVSETCRKFNVFMIHGTDPGDFVSAGTLNQHPMTWQEKIDTIINNKDIVLSSSTVTNGDENRHFFSPVGVILNEGEITQAWSSDSGSIRRGNGRAYPQRSGDFSKFLKDSINNRDLEWYNELAVERPSIAAIYFQVDTTDKRGYRQTDSIPSMGLKPLFEDAEKRGLKLRLYYHGQFYEPIQVEEELDYFVADDPKEGSGVTTHVLNYPKGENFDVRIPEVKADQDQEPGWLFDEATPFVRPESLDFRNRKGHWEKRKIPMVKLGKKIEVENIYGKSE